MQLVYHFLENLRASLSNWLEFTWVRWQDLYVIFASSAMNGSLTTAFAKFLVAITIQSFRKAYKLPSRSGDDPGLPSFVQQCPTTCIPGNRAQRVQNQLCGSGG